MLINSINDWRCFRDPSSLCFQRSCSRSALFKYTWYCTRLFATLAPSGWQSTVVFHLFDTICRSNFKGNPALLWVIVVVSEKWGNRTGDVWAVGYYVAVFAWKASYPVPEFWVLRQQRKGLCKRVRTKLVWVFATSVAKARRRQWMKRLSDVLYSRTKFHSTDESCAGTFCILFSHEKYGIESLK